MADLTIKDVRAKFPQYADMPDEALAGALHRKFYADMPQADFYAKIGLGAAATSATSAPRQIPQPQAVTLPAEEATGGFDQQLVNMLAYPGGQAPPKDFSSPAPNREGAYREAAPVVPVAPSAPVAPSVDPLIAALTGIVTAEPPAQMVETAMGQQPARSQPGQPDWLTQALEATGVHGPDDFRAPPAAPFDGEGFGALAARRGQQFAQGTTEAVASVPETLAITSAQGEANRAREAGDLSAERATMIEGIKAKLQEPDLDPKTREFLEGNLADLTIGQGVLGEMAGAQVQPAQDREMYKLGEKVRQASQGAFGTPDPRDQGFWSGVAQGAGNVAGMGAAAIAGGLAGGPAGALTAGGASGAAMNAPQLYKEAIEAGATEETARDAAKWGLAIGVSEIIPITRAIKLLPPRLRKEVGNAFLRRIIDIGQSGGEEAAQEYGQQVANNLVAQKLYDPERGWNEGAGQAALIGAVLGGGLGAIGTAIEGKKDAPPNRDRQEDAPPGKPVAHPPAVDPLLAALSPAPDSEAAPVVPESSTEPAQNIPENITPPAPEDRFEVMDEVENNEDGKSVPTGRKVRVDKETGQVSVVDANEAAGQPASATGDGDSVGKQPQADAEVVGADVTPAADARPEPKQPRYKNQPDNVEFLDATDVQNIQTDATTMQYKAGGDETGVTERLKGITEWKPERAGMSLIYEYADGRRVVADGHHRLGLAKRLASEGKPIQMPATILRETDGVTPAEARVAAALKNIAEGSGTAIDAAKVLRQSDQTPQQLGLPPNSALVRDAAGMRNLSDTAFGMVVNGKASERDGGIVGRLVTDKAAQENILALLNRLKPENAFQAETIVRQAAAETVTETQTSLFGDEQVQANLYLERAKVLDGAMKRVRDEEKAFKTIVEQADTFTEAGNVLDANANEDRLASGGKVRNYLASQANMKGPISDALSAAARSLKDGKRISTVTSEFLAAVTRGVEGNGQSGQDSNPAGRAPEQTGSAKSQPEAEVAPGADLFGAPQDDPQADLLNMMTGKAPDKTNSADSSNRITNKISNTEQNQSVKKPQGGRPQTDLFDQGDNSQPGERQTDIEDLIAEKPPEPETPGPEPWEELRDAARARVKPFVRKIDATRVPLGNDLAETPEGELLLFALASAKGLSSRAKIADDWVLRRGMATGQEHLVVLDKEGLPVFIGGGIAESVFVSIPVLRLAASDGIGHSTHNHPSSSGPSGADITMLAGGVSPVVIMAHNGDRHVVRSTAFDLRAKLQDWHGVPLSSEIRHAFSAGLDRMRSVIQDLINAGTISIDQANAVDRPGFALVLEAMGLVQYEGGTIVDIEATGVNFDDIYGPVSSIVADGLRRAGYTLPEARGAGGNRSVDSNSGAAPPSRGKGNRSTDSDAGNRDGRGRVSSPEVAPAKTGDADFDGALDDIFGKEADNVPSTGETVERDRGDRTASDGVGGADVSASGRDDAGRDQQGTGQGDRRNGEPGSGGGVSGDDAPSVGSGGDPQLSGESGPSRKPAPTGNSGRRAGGGEGGLPAGTAGSRAVAPDASGGTPRVTRSSKDIADDLNDMFGEDAPRFAFAEETTGLDARKYERVKAIFTEALDGIDVTAMDRRTVFAAMAKPLVAGGLTRKALEGMKPYFDAYLADLDASRISVASAPVTASSENRAAQQAKADKIRPIPVDQENIRATLPLLLPEQQDDVFKVETRYAKPDGHGMMLTNGTGTGKTYSGAGVIKRFLRQGKNNVLIVAPSEAVIAGWTKAAEAMGITVNKLKDTKDGGTGVTITTYANMQQNNALAKRSWDLVVTDEAQNLSMNAIGDSTRALDVLRAITHRPQDLWRKSDMMRAEDWERLEAMKDGAAKTAVAHRLFERRKADVERLATQPRSKVLFLSATPFAYDKTVDYGEGYLFDYPKDGRIGNSNQSGQAQFMVQNFGYRIRYHKLTKPETAVDSAVFEREFHEKLVREGVLSGRSLHVDVDYDRKFVLREDAQGTQIDTAMELIRKKSTNDTELGRAFQALEQHVRKAFTYHRRQQLLEAIKARMAVADIKKHLPMGRKVVVFHDFNVGGGFNPFASSDKVFITPEAATAYGVLVAENPWVAKLNFAGYLPPREAILQAFGDRAREFNGTVPQKKRLQALTDFNKDGSGVDVLVVQADAGGAGISMHDLTGNHQRVLINLGMPTKPTTTLQEEGRILRVGTMTNAPFRYYTIGTSWERHAFATRIAERSGTVENLALGNQARALREGFIDAYMEAEDFAPSESDGTGGKERDRATAVTSPYDRAKTHYFGRAKMKGKRDQRDGIDFFPTPEPLAFKMVEWAGLSANERVLEPSAGDGAIARYMPEDIDLTMVEPSSSLASTALLRAPQGKTVDSTFENYHIVNKHHVIVMNPPFGAGGKTAFDHLAKAMKHLRDGGRIVALVPTGPAADKRWNELWHSDAAKEFNWTADVAMPAVTFERAGTGVMSRVLILDRIATESERGAWGSGMGGTKHVNMTGSEKIEQFFDRLEGISVPRRPEPKVDIIEELEAEAVDATTPPARVTISAPMAAEVGAFALKQTVHAKTGGDLFVAVPENRVERDTYNAMLAVAKTHGGWYSSFRGNGAIPGFQFKTEAGRAAFVEDMAKPVQGLEESSALQAMPGFEERTPPQLVRDSKAATEDIARQMPALRRELDRLDLKRVRLAQDTGADWQARFVVTGDGAMEITIGASLDPMKSLHHEVIHALRTMNLFTVDEWRALSLAARKDWIKKHDILERYPSLTEWEQIEEAIAEEFAQALEAKRAPKGSLLINAFNKIARIFRAFRNVLNGAGYQTPEDIFGRVLAGEITKRNAGNTGAAVGARQQERPVVATLTGEEIAKGADMREMGRNAERWYRENLVGTSVTNGKTGMVVQFDGTGARKIGGRKGEDLYRMVPALREIIERGVVVASEPDRLKRPEFKAIHKIEARVQLGDRTKTVIATVREKADGTFHYDLSMERGAGGFASPTVQDQARTSALEGDPADLNIVEIDTLGNGLSDSAKYQRPRAVKPLTAQARAHRNTGMQGPLFIPDRRVWESLTQAGAPIWQRLREGRAGASDAVDRARVVIQDRFLPMLRAQEVIENTLGQRLPEEQNAYLRETTFSGKVGRHLFEIDEDFTKPIIGIIASTNGGLTADDVGTWLYARHAIERNARIASINLKMPDGGSGMTDAEAQGILAQAAAAPFSARLLAIGAKVDELRERTLKLREEKGLITPAEAQMWRTMYKHYVPLKGFAETDHSEATLDVGGIGNRLNVRGAESKRALGRQSEAFNPLQAAITQAQEASIRAEKNWVGQSIFELARDFPSAALWTVKQPKQRQYYNRTTGLVETRVEDPLSMILEPNEMAVKVKGKEVRILFHDERLARAAGTVGADQMSGIMRVLSIMSRFFSLTRTMLNPEFLVTNAFRDFQTAQFNIQAFGEGDKAKIATAMVKNWRKAFMGAMRGQKNIANDEWSKNYRAFQKAGGQVSFWTMENPVAAKEDLDHRINLARGSKAARALKAMTSPRALFSMRDNAVLDFIERSNLAVDNAIRLAAFTEARRLGWTEQDAAFLSKELTVNFNRRGEAGPAMNALYPFFNAAVQGSVRTLKAVSSKRVAKLVALAFTAGMLNDLLNAALSDDDDDGEKLYDKVPDFRSQRNFHLVLWGTGDNPIAIPMPYGYNLFPYAGQQLGKVARGVKSPEEAFADVVATAFGAFSPISGNDAYSALMPTMADPLLDMARNENWLGNPIYPKEWGSENFTPDSHLFFSTATEVSKWVAQTMNSLTGGDDLRSGAIDVSPETLDYMAAFVTGSAGAFWGRSFDVMAKTLSGNFDEIERRNVPFLRTVTTPVNEWQDRDRYYQFGARVKDAEHDRKAYVASGRPVPDTVKALADLYPALLAAERERKGQGEWNPKKTGATPPRDSDKVIMDFNRKYLRVMGRQAE